MNVASIGDHAFDSCRALTKIEIPNNVSTIGTYAFGYCNALTSVIFGAKVTDIKADAFFQCSPNGFYFRGNTPNVGSFGLGSDAHVIAYYLPGTTGWGVKLSVHPTALWLPKIPTTDPDFGVRTNQFEFIINWAKDQTIIVEACTNLANSAWQPLQTNTLTADTAYFSDSEWTNNPSRFYRVRSP